MQTTQQKLSRTTINYLVDIIIFLAFLIAMNPHATGISVHEWLGIAFGGALVTHLLLHWQWIVGITRQFLGQISKGARLNYVINLLFFIDMVMIIFTGSMISESVLPALGLSLTNNVAWRGLHTTAANLALPILGLHIALHWRWLVSTTKSYFRKPRPTPTGAPVHRLPKGLLQKGI